MSGIFILSMIWGYSCTSNPIYCQIVNNKPSINRHYALKLSNLVHRIAKKRKIDARIYTAILMQESGYNLRATNCKSIPSDTSFKYVLCTDYGISQIYFVTARSYRMDIPRLTKDLHYSLDMGAMVLRDFMVRYRHEEYYWTRYNASSTHKRAIYRGLVRRYL